MALPAWPAITDAPSADGFKTKPWAGNAIVTDFEGGNQRSRRRPGDSITVISQRIRMSGAELETFKTWFGTTLNGGSARFTMDVWTGSAFENKVCQFDLKTPPEYDYAGYDRTDVSMTLRVYGA